MVSNRYDYLTHREASDSCKPSAAAVASDERNQKKEQHEKVKFNGARVA